MLKYYSLDGLDLGSVPVCAGRKRLLQVDVQLNIRMLGGFSITHVMNGSRLEEQIKRSSKVLGLVQYLIAHRHKSPSQEELINVLWADESKDNPGSALRTMIYRARNMMVEAFGHPAADIIINHDGGYAWNNDISCVIDTEEFEKLCKQAETTADPNGRVELLMQALELYRGDFLQNPGSLMWSMPITRYYRSMYTKCVHEALRLLIAAGRAADAEMLCAKAMSVDQFDERILEYYLRALLSQGKNAEALEEYQRLEAVFYNEMGVTFSENLRKIYGEIQNSNVTTTGQQLDEMINEWRDGADFPGAYYCEAGVFKMIYQIEARSLERSGKTVYVIGFETKKGIDGKIGVMKELRKSISENLRKGDLFTHASSSQYICMLYSLTYENAAVLSNKILSKLSAKQRGKVKTIIRQVKPID